MPPSGTCSGRSEQQTSKSTSSHRNTVDIESPSQGPAPTEASQLPSGNPTERAAASNTDRGGSREIARGLEQLGVKLPKKLLAKVLANSMDKYANERFCGELYEGHVDNITGHRTDEAAWSSAATNGSEQDVPSRS
ncbi:hypothetical protein V494_04302 [Pseudogymnoascus sp. VKM F-4513 (FW-928)]|nr:hypothetical protein V494_04302 [Pseudogymnoascus sp. VKM F-4513 (FW-928)]